MLLIGYFEGLDAERAIAWRAADSFSHDPVGRSLLADRPTQLARVGSLWCDGLEFVADAVVPSGVNGIAR